jgi:hypothetical protein
MYSVIVLIIASSGDIYDLFLELWREKIKCWIRKGGDSLAVDYRFFFVFADPFLMEDVICKDDCIYCKCEESLEPGILLKTMMAMCFCENELVYDSILRTNLSSFWNFSVLSLEIISNMEISIGTIFFQFIDRNRLDINPRWKDYLERMDSLFPIGSVGDVFYFLDGAGFLLSREMIRLLLLPFPIEPLLDIPDDVAISILLFYRIFVCNMGRIEIKELLLDRKWIGDGWEGCDLLGFVRNKNGVDRKLDVLNFIHLVNHYYLKN